MSSTLQTLQCKPSQRSQHQGVLTFVLCGQPLLDMVKVAEQIGVEIVGVLQVDTGQNRTEAAPALRSTQQVRHRQHMAPNEGMSMTRTGDQSTFIMDPAWLLIEYFTWIYGIDITIGQAQSNGRSPCIHHGAGMWCLHNLLKRQEFLKCHQSCVFSSYSHPHRCKQSETAETTKSSFGTRSLSTHSLTHSLGALSALSS